MREGHNIITFSFIISWVCGLIVEIEDLSSTYKSQLITKLRLPIDNNINVWGVWDFPAKSNTQSRMETWMLYSKSFRNEITLYLEVESSTTDFTGFIGILTSQIPGLSNVKFKDIFNELTNFQRVKIHP